MIKLKRFFIGWVAVVLSLVISTAAMAQSGARTPSTDIFVRNYTTGGTNRVAYELTNLVNDIPITRPVRLHIDGGPWTINANVDFTTNITLVMYPGCPFNVSTGIVMSFSNNPLSALDWPIFTGWGTATGNCDFIYRWPDWGDTGRFRIGDGSMNLVTTNLLADYLLTSALSNAMVSSTVGYEYLDTDKRDDFTTNAAGEAWVKSVMVDTNIGILAQSYIAGCYPEYLTTGTVTLTAGDGYNNGNYFRIEEQTYQMQHLSNAAEVMYLYIVDFASTYPSDLVFTDHNAPPTYDPVRAGWYHSTSNRCIGAIYSASGASTIRPFTYNNGDYIFGSGWFWLGQGMATTGLWTNPTTQASSYYLPANASEALINIDNGPGPSLITNANDLVTVVATSQEAAYLAPGMINTNGGVLANIGIYRISAIGWIGLGPSLNVWYSGAADDPDNVNMALNGYRINR